MTSGGRGSAGGLTRAERGSVTAELAIVLPGVVLVLVAVLLIGAAALTQLRCADAARAGARAAALGDSSAEVQALVAELAGEGATVSVATEGDWVVVRVSQPISTGPFGAAGWRASAEFSVPLEPTGGGP